MATFTVSDFNLSSSNTDRVDMTRAVVVSEAFRWAKEYGETSPYALRNIPAEILADLEGWEIVGEIYVDETYYDKYEGKLEICGTTTLLIAPLKETEKPEFFKYEDEAARMGYDEYAA